MFVWLLSDVRSAWCCICMYVYYLFLLFRYVCAEVIAGLVKGLFLLFAAFFIFAICSYCLTSKLWAGFFRLASFGVLRPNIQPRMIWALIRSRPNTSSYYLVLV